VTTINPNGTGAHHGGLPTPTGRVENVVQVAIMLAVAAMAGAASFTHVHDWTMHNSPPGTGDWFGWANAMVSELIPLAAGLEVRRRRRNNIPVGPYPIALIIAAVALSLAGQLAEAKPGISGWLISAVPALGFLALVKLVLSGPTTATQRADTTGADHNDADDADEPVDTGTTNADTPPARPDEPASVPTHLLPTARFALVQHEQATGRTITANELAARMSVAPIVAGQLLTALNQPTTTAVPARVNGSPYTGARP
jgi:hypothetical protein